MAVQCVYTIRHFGDLNENDHHWFFYANSRSLIGENILAELGAVSLLEVVCHWGFTLGFQRSCHFQVALSFPFCDMVILASNLSDNDPVLFWLPGSSIPTMMIILSNSVQAAKLNAIFLNWFGHVPSSLQKKSN